jgi:hypothetical protein
MSCLKRKEALLLASGHSVLLLLLQLEKMYDTFIDSSVQVSVPMCDDANRQQDPANLRCSSGKCYGGNPHGASCYPTPHKVRRRSSYSDRDAQAGLLGRAISSADHGGRPTHM